MTSKIFIPKGISWEPVDEDHIRIVFHGHFDDNYAQTERELNSAGLYAVRRTYDKKTRKTTTIYKRTR